MFSINNKAKLLKVIVMLLLGVFLLLLTAKLLLKVNNINTQTLKLMFKMDASVTSDGINELPYRLYQPQDIDKTNKSPLVIVLQSAFRRGNNNYGQLTNLVDKFVSDEFQNLESAYVLAPHCPENMQWNNIMPSSAPYINYDMSEIEQSWRQTLIIELIDKFVEEKGVDPERIYITGISMGASGTWEMLYRFPEQFAGALILNGRSDPNKASQIAQTPIRMFHGQNDEIAPLNNSIKMKAALDKLNADVELKILEAGHDITQSAYDIDAFKWLLYQKKSNRFKRQING